jgi:hypothetical protein
MFVSFGNVVQHTSLNHNAISICLRESGQGLEVKVCLVVVLGVGWNPNSGGSYSPYLYVSCTNMIAGRMILLSTQSSSRNSAPN